MRERTLFLTLLGILAFLGPATVDLYTPAFPEVQKDFGVGAASVQLTLTASTIGFALGQLFVGPLSDVVGRRRPLLMSTTLHIGASLAIVFVPDISWMVALRVIQGIGASGSGVVSAAIVRDLFAGRAYVQAVSRLALITGMAPIVAPILGAQLLRLSDWRGLFVAVAAYGFAAFLLSAMFMKETLPNERRVRRRQLFRLAHYSVLLQDKRFMGIGVIGGMVVSAALVFNSTAPFLYQDTYGFTPNSYSFIIAINAISFVAGTQVTAFLMRFFSPKTLLAFVVPSLMVVGVLIAAGSMLGVVTVTAGTMTFLFGAGMCGPAMQVIAMEGQEARAGTAAALIGAMQNLLAGIASPIVGLLGVNSSVPMGLVMGTTMVIATLTFYLFVWKSGFTAESD